MYPYFHQLESLPDFRVTQFAGLLRFHSCFDKIKPLSKAKTKPSCRHRLFKISPVLCKHDPLKSVICWWSKKVEQWDAGFPLGLFFCGGRQWEDVHWKCRCQSVSPPRPDLFQKKGGKVVACKETQNLMTILESRASISHRFQHDFDCKFVIGANMDFFLSKLFIN